MSHLATPGTLFTLAASEIQLAHLRRPAFGMSVGDASQTDYEGADIRYARRTVNAPNDFNEYTIPAGTCYVVPGYTMREGDRLLVAAGADMTALKPNRFPFYDADGELIASALNVGGHVPFVAANGANDNIAMVA